MRRQSPWPARKQVQKVADYRFMGGIVLMLVAVVIFFADAPIAVPIGVLVVGIALVASGRRRSQKPPR